MNQTKVVKDSDHVPIAVSPTNRVSIEKDKVIPYRIIESASNFSIYFGTETGSPYVWPAYRPLATNSNMRLVDDTVCLYY